ncbi:MAG: tRNA (adenosine(37)-N6)-dimethylallyltransferase MiaA, partial [Bacteroidales bacterium]|nr:tRNA (adenosine(37)-N6)-dimethylallyltransferase MiaA [Bacteroidales bacterium]
RAEIISADSRQVYRGMDIGTGKDLDEYQEIPYHLIDIVPAGSRYNIYEYQQDFEKAWKSIVSRGGVPVLCGGSGLYIEAATCGYMLPQVPPNPGLRAELEQEDIEELREKLCEIRPVSDPSVMESKRRLIRALEVAFYEQEHPVQRTASLPKNVYYIGTLVSREDRVARIDRRLDERLAAGMVDEVKGLIASGISPSDLVYYGLEYKFVTQHVLGILSFDEMRSLLANAIHQFAKRQMTWFRGMERDGKTIHWTYA